MSPMSFAQPSHARTLLQLTYETDQALREGRLGAEEWFAFVSALEALARKIEHRSAPDRLADNEAKKDEAKKDEAKKDEAKENEAKKDEAKKDEAKKETRILSFPSSCASASRLPAAYKPSSARRAREER